MATEISPNKDWLDIITVIGSVATPLLVLVLSAVGWRLRQSFEKKIELENRLRDDRIEIYNQILEPFIIYLMTDLAWERDEKNNGKNKIEVANDKMMSLEYRKLVFKFSLIGSDSVVLAHNELMKLLFSLQGDTPPSNETYRKYMKPLLGTFLLEIRRSMGNEFTKLTNLQMLEWFIKDVQQ